MSKKGTKLTHAAHIKRYTEGTSNELSFSVLDAAKRRADADEGKADASQAPRFGKVSVFSLPGGLGQKKAVATPTKDAILPLSNGKTIVASGGAGAAPGLPLSGRGLKPGSRGKPQGLPYGSSADEIGRRKAKRRRRRAAMALVGSLAAVGLLGAGGYLLYQEVTNHQEQVSLLDQSLAQIQEVDKVIVPLDEIVNAAEGSSTPEEASSLLALIPDSQKSLDSAEALARQASENMRTSADKDAADQAIASIDARRTMLGLGATLLQAGLDAQDATDDLEQAWKDVWDADALARDAASLVTDTTNENVEASKAKSQEALDLFDEASYLFTEASNSPLQPDLQTHLDYVGKRRESMQCAIASDDAIIAQDRQAAEDQNQAYNLAEDEAAQIAKQLPDNTAEPILEAYRRSTQDPMREYTEARRKASTADAFLRDYLGT